VVSARPTLHKGPLVLAAHFHFQVALAVLRQARVVPNDRYRPSVPSKAVRRHPLLCNMVMMFLIHSVATCFSRDRPASLASLHQAEPGCSDVLFTLRTCVSHYFVPHTGCPKAAHTWSVFSDSASLMSDSSSSPWHLPQPQRLTLFG
jgi:hypothetical protein